MAGKAGFALYSGLHKKWKLFGNEIQVRRPLMGRYLSHGPLSPSFDILSQEQAMMCRGGLLWYRDVVVFPCRVQEKYEEVLCVYTNVSELLMGTSCP